MNVSDNKLIFILKISLLQFLHLLIRKVLIIMNFYLSAPLPIAPLLCSYDHVFDWKWSSGKLVSIYMNSIQSLFDSVLARRSARDRKILWQ